VNFEHVTAQDDNAYYIVYNDLAHPAATSIGDHFAYRAADGGYNNIDSPDMGKVTNTRPFACGS
jgi:linoleate 10R-lipoxygenase